MIPIATEPARARLDRAQARVYNARDELLKRMSRADLAQPAPHTRPDYSNNATILPGILDQLLILLHADGTALALIERERNEIAITLAHGVWADMSGYRMHASSVVNASDIVSSSLHMACEPLVVQGQTIGVLCAGCQSEITDQQRRILRSMGKITANAIHDQQRAAQERQHTYDTTLEGWVRALEMRDRETEEHTRRVTDLTVNLARSMGIGDEDLVHIRRGALLHDIGKIAIPDSILLKPGPLNKDEWKRMRQHPLYAYELLAPIAFLQPALDIPLYHHERWDGTGYPYGLQGEQIPLAARIFAVVDVWDSLRFDRPYRKGWSEEHVIQYIETQAGTHFDATVVQHFLRYLRPTQQSDATAYETPRHQLDKLAIRAMRVPMATNQGLLRRLVPQIST